MVPNQYHDTSDTGNFYLEVTVRNKTRDPRFLDDESPVTRSFTEKDLVPIWGQSELDRDREPFSQEEIRLAELIGLAEI